MTDGFRPCPICGEELTVAGLRYFYCDGESAYSLEGMIDPADPESPSNIEAVMGSRFDPKEWKHREGDMGDYRAMLEDIRYISIGCDCGFCFFADRRKFPEKGWLDEFRAKANRRSP